MRVSSRGFYVGFLLVLALWVSGCQPIQPVSEASTPEIIEPGKIENVAETSAITETQVISESVVVSPSTAAPSSSAAVTESVTITESSETTGTNGSDASATTADAALLEAGLTVYRAQYCGVCHTLDAAETRGTFGPTHNGMGEIAITRLADSTYQGKATTAAEYIHESIVDPQAYTVPGFAATSHRMPVYAHLDEATLDALVAFLLAQ
jgi:mono/diheme cytochrome c family protein